MKALIAAMALTLAMALTAGAAEGNKKYTEGSCCAKAAAKGEKCKHPCCVEAEGKGEVCKKCNKAKKK